MTKTEERDRFLAGFANLAALHGWPVTVVGETVHIWAVTGALSFPFSRANREFFATLAQQEAAVPTQPSAASFARLAALGKLDQGLSD